MSHRFHNEGNHQFIYRIPTRFLTMGLLFTRLWSLFTNEGMWWILRHCVFSWYHFYCKWTCWFLQECVLWRIQDHYSCTHSVLVLYKRESCTNTQLCQRLECNKSTRLSFMFITVLCNHSIMYCCWGSCNLMDLKLLSLTY